MPTLLSLGHGYSARYLARLLPGWRIIGTTRSADTALRLQADGVEPLIWPGTDLTPALTEATHLLISIAPTDQGDPVLNAMATAIRAANFEWVGYLSTTGVYGDRNGAWVTETSQLNPTTRRGAWRVQAESDWKQIDQPLHIFRLAGIYGPGRGPFEKIRNGSARRIIKAGQVFSRIHVEDIAQTLHASIVRPNPGAVYNVCDNAPAPPQDVISHAAQLLNSPLPPKVLFETADLSPMARSFYSESKRVSNDRIRTELSVELKYPDYKSGLMAILEAEQA